MCTFLFKIILVELILHSLWIFSKILKMHIDNFMTSVKHLKPLPLVTPEYYFPKIPQIFLFKSTIRQKIKKKHNSPNSVEHCLTFSPRGI